MRGLQKLLREVLISRPPEEVFPFFADARNLEKITPSFLRFLVKTPSPIDMYVGALIDYELRVRGLPLRWQSEITAWDPPVRFVDEQRVGPYRWWRHEHRFEAVDAGTRVIDDVEYAVPGGWIIDALFVRRDLRRIFDFRQDALSRIFPVKG